VKLQGKRSRLFAWLTGGILGVLGIGFAAYWWSPTILSVDSGECRAGALIVLGGDTYGRPLRAAELFKGNAAPFVIVSGSGDCEEMVGALKQFGVPESVISREDKSSNTKENAQYSIALVKQAGITNAIIVTSWYHSRRALCTFRKLAPGMQLYSRPSYYGRNRSDWSRTGNSRHIRSEYLKLLYYWVRYGVCPL
jgi:uncharacterized SAM-binding protein YcdF (DUF218 family)